MKHAFTMAEILLSLTIIGVVAAITLPSLTGNINERTWNTQRKALYARFSQAIALMPSLNGYGTLTPETSSDAGDAVDTAAETFVTSGLAKVLKINNICDNEHLEDCGIASKITTLDGSSVINLEDIETLFQYNSWFNNSAYYHSQLDTKAAAFETANGECILVYYNPFCTANLNENRNNYSQPKMCANFVYDLNGSKGPNSVGKDIGAISVLYATDPVVVAPMPLPKNSSAYGEWSGIKKACAKDDSDSRGPNIDELSSMFYNGQIFGLSSAYGFWSSSIVTSDSSKAWWHSFITGQRSPLAKDAVANGRYLRCIKR